MQLLLSISTLSLELPRALQPRPEARLGQQAAVLVHPVQRREVWSGAPWCTRVLKLPQSPIPTHAATPPPSSSPTTPAMAGPAPPSIAGRDVIDAAVGDAATGPTRPGWYSQPCFMGIGATWFQAGVGEARKGAWGRGAGHATSPDVEQCTPPPRPPDEAGRGPVLGSMVYGSVYAPLADKDAVASKCGEEAGGRGVAAQSHPTPTLPPHHPPFALPRKFADSKALTEAVREALFESITADARLGARVHALGPAAISAAMLGRCGVGGGILGLGVR